MLHLVQYGSIDEALAVAVRTPPSDAAQSRVDTDGRRDWYGDDDARTFDGAVRMARTGDPKGALLLNRALDAIPSVKPARRATMRLGDVGTDVDLGRFTTGNPDCLYDVVPARRPSQTVRIAIERAVGANTSTEEMRSTGASVLAVVEQLRLSGYPAEVWVTFTQMHTDTMSVQVRVQDAGRPVNSDVLAFWVSNPAAFRRVGFALEEQQPADVRHACGITAMQSYGFPTRNPGDGFDEVAPARSYDATEWISDVLNRRIGDRRNDR